MIQPGTRLSHYNVVSMIGRGGMGEVWKAADTRLGREVAIKTLPKEFAQDPERLARFSREARLLASLNHPNIAAIHGFEEDSGIRFLVLELVSGDTLADRLKRGPIPAEEALRIALQIAEALEVAHEKGVVHRDLKPANIKITPEGRVKVLDFGLAKAFSADHTEVDLSQSPTLSVAGTRDGVLLGTAAYMSPEQASASRVDKRTDIWSFGVVLFEMLTGQPLFSGETVSHLLAAVLRDEPEWARLPPGLHPQIRFLLKRCLEKKVRDRSHDISDARVSIRNTLDDPAGVFVPMATETKKPQAVVKWIIAGAMILGIAVLGAAYLFRTPSAGPAMRFAATLPEGVHYSVGEDFLRSASLSPDGRTLVFTGVDTATGRALLYVRSIDAIEALPLEGTEDASGIFWAPDSRSIGFFSRSRVKTISIAGGPPTEIANANNLGGATWNRDGVILASLENPGPLHMIPADGSPPGPITSFDPSVDIDHDFPWFLDDGRHFLYLSWGRNTDAFTGNYALRRIKKEPRAGFWREAHHTPATAAAAPRARVRIGRRASASTALMHAFGPNLHNMRCLLGWIAVSTPSPTNVSAHSSFKFLVFTSASTEGQAIS